MNDPYMSQESLPNQNNLSNQEWRRLLVMGLLFSMALFILFGAWGVIQNMRYQFYNGRANSHWEQGELEQSVEDFSKAIEINPGYAGTYHSRGQVYLETGQLQQAVEDFTTAVQRDRTFAAGYRDRGYTQFIQSKTATEILEIQERSGHALVDLDRAIELNPTDGLAYFYRGSIHSQLLAMDDALSDFNQAIEQGYGAAEVYYKRAVARAVGSLLSGRTPLDIGALDLAIEMDLDNPDKYYDRGRAHLWLGNLDAALVDFEEILFLDHTDYQAYHGLGLVHWATGRYKTAVDDFRVYLKLNPAALDKVEVEADIAVLESIPDQE